MPDKEIFDAIHGYIVLSELAQSFCDTPEFQRLSFIKQLGASSFVFPCADHSRKAHSFGCYHIAQKMANHLKQNHPNIVSPRDVDLISVAGLLHDIGHGPFSHVFDRIMKDVENSISHEERGCKLIEMIVQREKIAITQDELVSIQHMIDPPARLRHCWKYQIVSGVVDADRCDYIPRDMRNIGTFASFGPHNINRIIAHMSILEGELVFSWKASRDIMALLEAREFLHRTVYQHRVSIAIETMITDLVELCDPEREFRNRVCQDLSWFSTLTDSLLVAFPYKGEAVSLAKRIWGRDLYRVIDHDFPNCVQDLDVPGTSYCRWIGLDTGDEHPMKQIRFVGGECEKELPPHRQWRISVIIRDH